MVERSCPPDSPSKPVANPTHLAMVNFCTSSSPSFLFGFSVSADPRDGFPRYSSLTSSLLSVVVFFVLITVSCDEDVEEAGEDEAEELVDRPETTNGT